MTIPAIMGKKLTAKTKETSFRNVNSNRRTFPFTHLGKHKFENLG